MHIRNVRGVMTSNKHEKGNQYFAKKTEKKSSESTLGGLKLVGGLRATAHSYPPIPLNPVPVVPKVLSASTRYTCTCKTHKYSLGRAS